MKYRFSFGQDRRNKHARKYESNDTDHASHEKSAAVPAKDGNTAGESEQPTRCSSVFNAERKGYTAAGGSGEQLISAIF